jgi:pimeloyl-ACP methyl ester carboxylesterase
VAPITRYAKSGDVRVAYRVFGEGPLNLVIAPFFVSNIEVWWEYPDAARWMLRLASFAWVAVFDKRGTGMSDRVTELPGLEQRIDDVRAVMDAVGMERAALLGMSEGGSLTALFAATYPERCSALVLYGSFARFASWLPTEEALACFLGYIDQAWGSGGAAHQVSFSLPRCRRPCVPPQQRQSVISRLRSGSAIAIRIVPRAPRRCSRWRRCRS